jgi:AhpD family alkylhydroperoxidase
MARIELPVGDAPETVRALTLRPRLAMAVAAYNDAVNDSALDWRLHELVRMRIAQINGCTVCLAWRSPQAKDVGLTPELLDNVADYATAPGYTDAERVAIEYAELFCTDSTAITDELLARLAEHLDPGEIVDLTLCIGKYLANGRFMQVLGLDQSCALDIQPALS